MLLQESPVSPDDTTKLAIHSILRPENDLRSNCGQNFRKIASFADVMHFIDEGNIVTCVNFQCGITFYPETPKKQTDQPRTELHFQIL